MPSKPGAATSYSTKVSCSTAIAGCRANPLEATKPIYENPKFWSNQTKIMFEMTVVNLNIFFCVKSCRWEIFHWSFREDQIPHWHQSSFSKRFYLTRLSSWHFRRPRQALKMFDRMDCLALQPNVVSSNNHCCIVRENPLTESTEWRVKPQKQCLKTEDRGWKMTCDSPFYKCC